MSNDGKPVVSVLIAMKLVLSREGITGLFKGLFTDLIKGMLDAAVMMMVKERIHQGVRNFFYSLAGQPQPIKKSKPGLKDEPEDNLKKKKCCRFKLSLS